MDANAPHLNEQLAGLVKYNVLETLGQGRTLARALELARQAHCWADHLIDRFESENPLPHRIACQPGCHFCCFNQIEVTPPEALSIGDYVKQHFSDKEKDRLLERLARSVNQKAGKTKSHLARMRQEFPCPFLSAGLCAVYPVRPLLCRAMHALDAAQCERSLQAADLPRDTYYLHRHEIVHSIIKGLTEGCREVGCEVEALDLARAVLIFFNQDENLPERWIQGEAVFA
jgi:Fe-S-cluster containining protein